LPRSHANVLLLGAGLAGLSAAWHLRESNLTVRHVERSPRVGGHAITLEDEGFRFDRTGHLLHLRDASMRALIHDLLGDELRVVERRSEIFSHGVYTPYPFQANTHGLPKQVAFECVRGFVEAHLAREKGEQPPPQDFESFCLQAFGEGISKHFMIPYNTRLWGVSPRDITAEWCSRFVPIPTLDEVLRGAVGLPGPALGYNANFVYPRRGIGALAEALAERVPAISFETAPHHIDHERRLAYFDKEIVEYDHLLSTIPLQQLGKLMHPLPTEVAAAFAALRCTSLSYLDVAVDGPLGRDFHWIYVPEARLPFYRVGAYSQFSPDVAPPGTSSLYVELADRSPASLERILPDVVRGLVEMGLLPDASAVRFARLRRLDHAYVIFDHAYFGSLATIRPFLEAAGVTSFGRYGGWNYSSMEDALLFGREAAARIVARSALYAATMLEADETTPAISIVIPVYNEEAILHSAVVDLRERLTRAGFRFEILLAENGSRDGTVAMAAELAARYPDVVVFSLGEPNYGRALREGILRARGDIVICEEIDLCDVRFHEDAVRILDSGQADLVIGSKLLRTSHDDRPLSRHAASLVYNGLLKVLLGFRGTDTHGLKAFRRDALLPVVRACLVDKDVFASELVIRADRAAIVIREIPVRVMEKRPPSIRLGRRVPAVVKQLVKLTWSIRAGGNLGRRTRRQSSR
jgi:protoporphyrinogen oxidase